MIKLKRLHAQGRWLKLPIGKILFLWEWREWIIYQCGVWFLKHELRWTKIEHARHWTMRRRKDMKSILSFLNYYPGEWKSQYLRYPRTVNSLIPWFVFTVGEIEGGLRHFQVHNISCDWSYSKSHPFNLQFIV